MTSSTTTVWGALDGSPAVVTLERLLAADRMPHALLIHGPDGVGKHGLALAVAQALNCESIEAARPDRVRACGHCRACTRIAGSNHADVETVAPGGLCRVNDHDHSRSLSIGICAVRRMEMVGVTQPYEGSKRVFMVDPADALTSEAADAFLKTLEEPPPAVTFLLVTSRPAVLSETARSRCRALALPPLPVPALAKWLEQTRELPSDRAAIIARMAGGRAGWALNALDDGDPLELRRTQAAEIQRLTASDRAERLAYAESLAGRGLDPTNALTALAQWIAWWRDVLLAETGCSAAATHQDHREELTAAAQTYRSADVVRFLAACRQTQDWLQQGVHPRLAMEALLVRTPAPQAARSVEA